LRKIAQALGRLIHRCPRRLHLQLRGLAVDVRLADSKTHLLPVGLHLGVDALLHRGLSRQLGALAEGRMSMPICTPATQLLPPELANEPRSSSQFP